MRFFAHESKTDKPLKEMSLQLQIENGEYISVKTDSTGHFELSDEYKGKRVSTSFLKVGFTPWTVAEENATLEIDTQCDERSDIYHEYLSSDLPEDTVSQLLNLELPGVF
ncbi:MAG: hypothetical protein QM652_07355 [Legionella sp.]|uniref:hypothetical protein n=1 Tax=Legionella sp. TaxID=459 RepID=UPI0039E49DC1